MQRIVITVAVIIAIIVIIMLVQHRTERTAIATESPGTSEKARLYPPAVELVNPAGFINSEPFNLSDFIGKKVILIDFWTYSCINCQRTLPYLRAWNDAYSDGLLIVGVHSPEFSFEKERANVEREVRRWNLSYPIVLDNDMATWRAYKNRYWPAKYLIDIDGYIRYYHAGEGAYAETEAMIRELLQERAERLGESASTLPTSAPAGVVPVAFEKIRTPEIYFGLRFLRGNQGQQLSSSPQVFTPPRERKKNTVYLDGQWVSTSDYTELLSETGSVWLKYEAKNVNIVASAEEEQTVTVFIDNESSTIPVGEETLYSLANAPSYGEHVLELRATKGFRIYTFTFG